MKKKLTYISAFLALSATSLYAHCGPGNHDEWPFPDFKWSLAIGVVAIIGVTIHKLRSKV